MSIWQFSSCQMRGLVYRYSQQSSLTLWYRYPTGFCQPIRLHSCFGISVTYMQAECAIPVREQAFIQQPRAQRFL